MIIMTSSRPYFLRAVYEWIAGNEMTPFVVVNANFPEVSVPSEHVEDGSIILNVSETAVRKLTVSNEAMQFDACFSGVVYQIYAPIAAISAIYARENGRGIIFEDDGFSVSEGGSAFSTASEEAPTKKGKPKLTLVK